MARNPEPANYTDLSPQTASHPLAGRRLQQFLPPWARPEFLRAETHLLEFRVEHVQGLIFMNFDAEARPVIPGLRKFAPECESYGIPFRARYLRQLDKMAKSG